MWTTRPEAYMRKAISARMPAGKLEALRRLLELKATEVRTALSAGRAAEIVFRPEEPLDFGDWCQKSYDEWMFVNQNRIEKQLLRELEEALHRFRDGTFGLCQGCEEPIDSRRLTALPWAKFCISCQEKLAGGQPEPALPS